MYCPVLFSQAHIYFCNKFRLPASELNILTLRESNGHYFSCLELVNSGDILHDHLDFLSLDRTKGFIDFKQGNYYLDTSVVDNFGLLKLTQKVLYKLADNKPYTDAVKQIINLSLLCNFDLCKKLHPVLFKNLAAKYTNFSCKLDFDLIKNQQILEQDHYLKLLSIFQINVDIQSELQFYLQLLLLRGDVARIHRGKIEIYKPHKYQWETFVRSHCVGLGLFFYGQLSNNGENHVKPK